MGIAHTKGGQVSVFIIIGVIMLLSVALVYIIADNKAKSNKQEIRIAEEVGYAGSVRQFVQRCVDDSSKEAIVQYCLAGGKVYNPEQILKAGTWNITYLHYINSTYLINEEDAEITLSAKTAELIMGCVDDFNAFPGKNIDHSVLDIEVDIKEEGVLFNVNFPVEVKEKDSVEKMDKFERFHNLNMLELISTVNSILEQERLNMQGFNITHMMKQKLDVSANVYGADNKLYFITDMNEESSDRKMVFMFASRITPDANFVEQIALEEKLFADMGESGYDE